MLFSEAPSRFGRSSSQGSRVLPLNAGARPLSKFDLGWMRRAESAEAAMTEVKQLRLLSRAELQKLFPHASIHVERFAGIPKSFVAYGMVSSQ